jgi:NADP-dependent aldehyde dehydrogenase
VGRAVQRAIAKAGLPAGVFALLFDASIDVGRALVEHPAIKAVGFTGSTAAGQALMRLCAARPEPIPVYAEMGSANPLFILPGALRERSSAIAQHLQISFTLGSGQMCTKPGLVFLPGSGSAPFLTAFQAGAAALAPQQMLTPGIRSKYASAIQERKAEGLAASIAEAQAQVPAGQAAAIAEVFSVTLSEFQATPELEEEIFGPTTLLIHYGPGDDLLATARSLHGHLTATIHASEEDLPLATELARVLQGKAGRVIFNGYPTGVEVCAAMVHGGPFPSTSDGRSSSVGTRAILRFARPVCFQDYPDAALPRELQRANPLGILRLVNGTLSRDAQA